MIIITFEIISIWSHPYRMCSGTVLIEHLYGGETNTSSSSVVDL